MKTKIIQMSVLAVVIASVVSPVSAQSAQSSAPQCKALVQISNDLYSVSQNGTPITRFTTDGKSKYSAALSPDGQRVVYMNSASSDGFVVGDSLGSKNSFPAAKPTRDATPDGRDERSNVSSAPLMDVSWASQDTVQLRKHVGKDNSRFEFYKLAGHGLPELRQAVTPSMGSACAVSPIGTRTACLQGNDVLVDGNVVFSADTISGSQPTETMSLKTGGSALAQSIRGLKVQVVSVSEGITLRVTLPTGNWTQSRVASGDFMEAPVADKTVKISPTLTDSATGLVKVTISSNSDSHVVLRNALAWTPAGDQLALIRNTSAGSELMLIKSKGPGSWELASRATFPLNEPVEAIQFVSPYQLVAHSDAQAISLPVTMTQSASGPSFQMKTMSKLPRDVTVTLKGKSVKTPVIDWACN